MPKGKRSTSSVVSDASFKRGIGADCYTAIDVDTVLYVIRTCERDLEEEDNFQVFVRLHAE